MEAPLVGRREAGYSLLEVLVVLALVGILSAIAIPAMGRFFQEYRLNKVAREVRANIQLARLKAVTSNFDVIFTYELGTSGNPDTYQIAGDEDIDGGGLQAWEDVNGNSINDGLADLDRNPPMVWRAQIYLRMIKESNTAIGELIVFQHYRTESQISHLPHR